MPTFCPECGTPLPYESAKFCTECGTRVSGSKDQTHVDKPAADDEPAVKNARETQTALPKDELIRSIVGGSPEDPRVTDELSFDAAKIPFAPADVQADLTAEPGLTIRVPPEVEGVTAALWRVLLISANRAHKPVSVEFQRDVVIGRATFESKPDLDLTDFGGARLGVSRIHALLRPTNVEAPRHNRPT
jgi:hypothetical protein